MEVLRKKIQKIILRKDDVSEIIGKKIIEYIDNKNIPTIESISNDCSVAISTVTKFAKKIGYSGYRELIFNMQLQIKNDKKTRYEIMNEDSNIRFDLNKENIINYIKYVDIKRNDIINIQKLISKSKLIWLICNEQLYSSVDFFNTILLKNNIQTRFFKQTVNNYGWADIQDLDILKIFFIAGADNESIINIYNKLPLDVKKQIIILTTYSSSDLFNTFHTKIIVDQYFETTDYFTRNMCIHYLMLQIASGI